MKAVREQLQPFLCKAPRFYSWMLRLMGRGGSEKHLFLSLIRRGWTVFDIGANCGYFTALFSDLVGSGGEVWAFEPGPSTFGLLNARVGGRRNCVLHRCALGEVGGVATMHQPGEVHGQASLRQHSHGGWAVATSVRTFEVTVAKLDDMTQGLRRLDFIKCDVEGAELPVLLGGRETLARFSPILFLEVFSEWTRGFGYEPGDLLSFLTDAGYSDVFLAEDRLRAVRSADQIVGSCNLLCAQAGRLRADGGFGARVMR